MDAAIASMGSSKVTFGDRDAKTASRVTTAITPTLVPFASNILWENILSELAGVDVIIPAHRYGSMSAVSGALDELAFAQRSGAQERAPM